MSLDLLHDQHLERALHSIVIAQNQMRLALGDLNYVAGFQNGVYVLDAMVWTRRAHDELNTVIDTINRRVDDRRRKTAPLTRERP